MALEKYTRHTHVGCVEVLVDNSPIKDTSIMVQVDGQELAFFRVEVTFDMGVAFLSGDTLVVRVAPDTGLSSCANDTLYASVLEDSRVTVVIQEDEEESKARLGILVCGSEILALVAMAYIEPKVGVYTKTEGVILSIEVQ